MARAPLIGSRGFDRQLNASDSLPDACDRRRKWSTGSIHFGINASMLGCPRLHKAMAIECRPAVADDRVHRAVELVSTLASSVMTSIATVILFSRSAVGEPAFNPEADD